MGYSFGLCVGVGGQEPYRLADFEESQTYNVAPMYRLAFGCDDGVKSIRGKTCAEAAPLLDQAIAYFEAHREELEALNPSNGWGDRKGALATLRVLREWCHAAPKAVFYVGVAMETKP